MLENLRWGKNWPGGENTDWLFFFSRGKKLLDSFFPGEEMGRPDPSPGKDWRGGKTDCYTGSELVTSHSPKQTLYRATEAGKRYYTQVIIDENIL